jgi:hypothetical protein
MSFSNRSKDSLRRRGAVLVLMSVMAVVLAAGLPPVAAAETDADEGLPGDWLSRYASPFAIGMGGASVAVGHDPQSALWNPASLSWLQRNTAQATSTVLFDDTSVNGLGFAVPANRLPTFGLNILYLKSGEFEKTNALNESLGTFSEGDLVMALTGSHQLADRWSVGANVKLVRQTLEDFSGGGMGFDLGLLGELVPGVKLGAAALNLGGPTITLREKDETYAQEYRAGLSTTVLEGNGLVAAEAVHRDGPGTQLRLGGQFRIGALALRLGYYIENIAAGFSYHFENGLSLDYGMNDHELGMVHRFGLNYAFGGFFADSQAKPDVFSPMGRNPVTKFLLTAHTKQDVRDWQLTIRDRSGEIVRTYAGQGQPPAHIIWDGKDAAGLPLPDGFYAYVLQVVENDGRATQARERSVQISTGGPQGSIGVQ